MTSPSEMTNAELCDEMQAIEQLPRRGEARRAARPRYTAIYNEFDARRMASLKNS